jgi:hypothetical protein
VTSQVTRRSDERALIDALCRGAITLALLWPGLAGAHLE